MSKDNDLTFHPLKLSLDAFGTTRSLGVAPQLHPVAGDNNTHGIPTDAEFVEVAVGYSYDSPTLPEGAQWFSIAFQFGLVAPDDESFGGFPYQVTQEIDGTAGNFHHHAILGTYRVPLVNGEFNLLFNESSNSAPFGAIQGQLTWTYLGYWK